VRTSRHAVQDAPARRAAVRRSAWRVRRDHSHQRTPASCWHDTQTNAAPRATDVHRRLRSTRTHSHDESRAADHRSPGVRLRRVDAAAIVDRSAPNLVADMSDAEVSAHIGSLLDFNIEAWLPLLGDWTFADRVRSTDRRRCAYVARRVPTTSTSRRADGLASLHRRRLAPTLARMMADNGDRGAFVKLSSRSAKDAPGMSRTLDRTPSQRCAARPTPPRMRVFVFSLRSPPTLCACARPHAGRRRALSAASACCRT
jgi:hypothetical protein